MIEEEESKQQKALRDFLYQFGKSTGIIWLAKKIPFLKLKDWVKRRENR